ncbi:hypothetical protein ACFOVU_24380 [Nocardiopsis sediminis]|uniref:Uncharacterized protein n=1 Tax=Nocardiopsis sediminis TaxID=1778267 RepID=A0ABV8FX44_9ACTN
MWYFRRALDDALIDFLLERLDDAGMERLDGHEPLEFRVDDHPVMPNWDPPYRFVRGCKACSREPRRYDNGVFGFAESLVERWPCPTVRSLAELFADDPLFARFQQSWWP